MPINNLNEIPRLGSNDIHVISIFLPDITTNTNKLVELQKNLSTTEHKEAQKRSNPQVQKNFIATRGILKYLLGKYLNTQPCELDFNYNKYGKPSLENVSENQIFFNVSHSKQRALLAFSKIDELGIDIEYIRSNVALESIARKFFTTEENQAIYSLDQEQQLHAFFNCWSRKEAFIKAMGVGLYHPLKNFSLDIRNHAISKIDKWIIQPLNIDPQYAAALAAPYGKISTYFLRNNSSR